MPVKRRQPVRADTNTTAEANPAAASQSYRREALAGLVLVALTLAVFWHACDNGFIDFDDPLYVTNNPHVQSGLNLEGLQWAFTTTRAGYWIPLTWLSYQLDNQLYGLEPRGYHLTNLLLHCVNTLLVFLVLRRMTGAFWPSAFVAALFAVHPLRVESVAWVTERKDVLSTLFWMLTLYAYAWYVECPGRRGLIRYVLVAGLMVLGNMAKPMLVTLPGVLLLLDYWPLARVPCFRGLFNQGQHGEPRTAAKACHPFRLVIYEKLPLLGVSAVFGMVTLLLQQQVGATTGLSDLSFPERIANALVSYVRYMWMTIWPSGLAVYYPHPVDTLSLAQVLGALLLLAGISVLAFRARRRCPYLVVGWLWYLGTLVPVIGLAQAGPQALADRFTYVPLIGLFIMAAWGVPDLLRWSGCPEPKLVLGVSAGIVLASCSLVTWLQVCYWKDDFALWAHADEVTADNDFAKSHLGWANFRARRYGEAARYFGEAARIKPGEPEYHCHLGNALLRLGQTDLAIASYSKALQLRPSYALAHQQMGVALAKKGKPDEAIPHFTAALELEPDNAETHYHLGVAFVQQGRLDQAVGSYRRAIGLDPSDDSYHRELAYALWEQGKTEEARAEYQAAFRLDPHWPQKVNEAAWLLATHPDAGMRQGDWALRLARQLMQSGGDPPPEHLDTLAAAYAEVGRFEDAVKTAAAAVQLASVNRPDLVPALGERLRRYEQREPFRDPRHPAPALAGENPY